MNQSLSVKISRLLLATLLFVGMSTLLLPVSKASAQTPSGPTKRLIVRYSNVLGANTDDEVENEGSGYVNQVYKFKHIPFGVYEADSEGEQSLNNSVYVSEVSEERYDEPLADLPIPTIGGNPVDNSFSDTVTSTVYDGSGYAVAVLDTGVDKNHTALSGRVIAEACFSTNDVGLGVSSLCPGGVEFSNASNSGLDCDNVTIDGCGHGTTVAGAIAMAPFTYDVDSDTVNDLFSGVAVGSDIVAIKVFSEINNVLICGLSNPCVRTTTTNQLQALDYLVDLDVGVPIVAANMSLGSGNYATHNDCSTGIGASNYSAYQSLISQLSDQGIATIIANGNSGDIGGNEDKIASPACVQGAISVGATNILGSAISSYSNNSSLTSLLAPGGDWDGVNDDSLMWLPLEGTPTGINGFQGTSQATPMVSGAFAVLREKHPNASVGQLLGLLQSTGTDVTENRVGYSSFSKKLIDLTNALSTSTVPTIDSFTEPGGVVNERVDVVLTVTTSNVSSCSMNNGIGNVDVSGGTVTVKGFASYELTCIGNFGDTDVATLTPVDFNAGPTVPSAGQPLSVVTNVANRSATVSWTASTDPDGIDFYEVYLDGALVDTTTDTSFVLEDLGLNLQYTVDVYAVDSLGARSPAVTSGVVLASTTTPGTPDTGLLNLFGNTTTQVVLSVGAIVSTGSVLVLGRRYF